MQKIDLIFGTVALCFLSLTTYNSGDIGALSSFKMDTIPQDIETLKIENLMLTKDLVEQSKKKDSIVYVKNTKVILPPKEYVYLRIDGKVHEVNLDRDKGTNRFIIDIDSLIKSVNHD